MFAHQQNGEVKMPGNCYSITNWSKRSTPAERAARRAARNPDPVNVNRLEELMKNPNKVPPRTEEEKAAIAHKHPPERQSD